MGGISSSPWKAGKKKKHDKDWEELGRKVEKKVMREVEKFVEDAGKEVPGAADSEAQPGEKSDREKEWEELGRKVEEKIKRKVRKWAEEE